jgi:chemotaxis protein MotB
MSITRIQLVKPKQLSTKAPLWMVGFTDLITILLAFFILLFATAQPKKDSWDQASNSLRTSFGGKEQAADMEGAAGAKDADKTWHSVTSDPALNLDYLYSLVKKYLKSDPALSGINVYNDEQSVTLSFDEELGFAPGKSDVSLDGQAILKKLAPFFISMPNALAVIGHTDQSVIRNDSSFSSNWELSLMRAHNVAEVLKQSGYDQDIAIQGRGQVDAPAGDTQNNGANPKARRVEIHLYMVHP